MACCYLVMFFQTLDEFVDSHKMCGQRQFSFEVNGPVLLSLHGTDTLDVAIKGIGFDMLKEFKQRGV